jgi:hypothetical protein
VRLEVQSHAFLIRHLIGGEWSASRPGRFTPGLRVLSTNWLGGWVAPRAVWTRWWREELPSFSQPGTESRSFIQKSSHYTDRATAAPSCILSMKNQCANNWQGKLKHSLTYHFISLSTNFTFSIQDSKPGLSCVKAAFISYAYDFSGNKGDCLLAAVTSCCSCVFHSIEHAPNNYLTQFYKMSATIGNPRSLAHTRH